MSASLNSFESGNRKSIPAVLVYARYEDQILMIHRNASPSSDRPADHHAGRWNGLGGKCEADESPIETARREFFEEAGIEIHPNLFNALGVLQFPNFKAHKNEDWIVFVFSTILTSDQKEQLKKANEEGELNWVPIEELPRLNLWPGDRHFLPLVADQIPFMGTIWYKGAEVERHWVTPLGGT